MTATTGPPNFGPLTTIFSPPSWCTQEKWVAHNSTEKGTLLHWGATCDSGSIGFATECYPPGWSGSNNSHLSYKAFSPGLACPYGFTGAASASHIERSNHFVLSDYLTDLGERDLATACCPKNYDYDGHLCVSHTLSFASKRPFITTSGSSCISTTGFKYFQSIGSDASIGQATFQAYPVIIVQDSRTSTSLIRPPENTGGISDSSSESSGLSTGTKIAIGVCVPIGIIIFAAICFIWWHRRRARAKSDPDSGYGNAATSAELHGQPGTGRDVGPFAGKPELDASDTAQVDLFKKQPEELEARDGGVHGVPVELPAQNNGPSELSGQDGVDASTPQAELPADLGDVCVKGSHGDDPDADGQRGIKQRGEDERKSPSPSHDRA